MTNIRHSAIKEQKIQKKQTKNKYNKTTEQNTLTNQRVTIIRAKILYKWRKTPKKKKKQRIQKRSNKEQALVISSCAFIESHDWILLISNELLWNCCWLVCFFCDGGIYFKNISLILPVVSFT